MAGRANTINELIDDIILNSPEKNYNPIVQDLVTVITIHSAKGMESENCYIINVSQGSFPSPLDLEDEGKLEEERRVLYVALTRAKNKLIITRINNDNSNEKSNINSKLHSSYFLKGISENLVEFSEGGGGNNPKKDTLKLSNTPNNHVTLSFNEEKSKTITKNDIISIVRNQTHEEIQGIKLDFATAKLTDPVTLKVTGRFSSINNINIEQDVSVMITVYYDEGRIQARQSLFFSNFGTYKVFQENVDLTKINKKVLPIHSVEISPEI